MAAAGCATHRGTATPEEVVVAQAIATSDRTPASSTPRATEPKPLAIHTQGGFNPGYTAIDARLLGDASIIDSKFATSLNPNVDTVTRLESTWTQLREESDHSLRIGDAVSTSGLWGSSVRFGGVQFGTRMEVRRDVIATPKLASSGIAVLPSVADALLASAGARQLREQSLFLNGGVKIAGANTVNFTARDRFGRTQSITAPLIADPLPATTPRDGCEDFAFGLGRVRRDYAIVSNDYGPLFANTTFVCGAPLGFTIEGHGEYLSDELTAFGIGLIRRIGSLGTASMAVASSRAPVGSGWLARFGFDHESELFNLSVRSRTQSREFREIATLTTSDPIMERNLASFGMKMGDGSLAVTYATQTTWDRERVDLIGLSQSLQLGRSSVSMTAGHSLVAAEGSSVFISFTRPFGFYTRKKSSLTDEIEPLLNNSLPP
jgi:outer membrane usher protein